MTSCKVILRAKKIVSKEIVSRGFKFKQIQTNSTPLPLFSFDDGVIYVPFFRLLAPQSSKTAQDVHEETHNGFYVSSARKGHQAD